MEFKKITFTDWGGKIPMSMTIPVDCYGELKFDIMDFLLGLDDHDAIDQCCKIWNLDEDEYERIMEYGYQEKYGNADNGQDDETPEEKK